MRAGEPDALEPLDLAGRAQQLAERQPVAELDAVGVDVLPEQRDLDGAVVDEQSRSRSGCRRAAGPSPCRAARARCRTCRCCCSRPRSTPSREWVDSRARRQRRREDLERLEDLELRLAVVPRALEQGRQRAHVVGAEDHVDPGRLLEDDRLVLLGEAAADGDLHALVLALAAGEVAEGAVELVVGVLADGAGVDDDDVGLAVDGADVAGGFERAAEAARSRARSSGSRTCAPRRCGFVRAARSRGQAYVGSAIRTPVRWSAVTVRAVPHVTRCHRSNPCAAGTRRAAAWRSRCRRNGAAPRASGRSRALACSSPSTVSSAAAIASGSSLRRPSSPFNADRPRPFRSRRVRTRVSASGDRRGGRRIPAARPRHRRHLSRIHGRSASTASPTRTFPGG